ncbi:polyprenyl synthetase family protein [Streptomyces sp. NPDC019531]|uniref:polyprenyl synthetase family protein n=1 Tax=Streptomyces sp. NPDC019531 TaxID=3365062 RepID=UPI00384C6B85
MCTDEYRAKAERKTGAPLGCAAALGALLGRAPPATVAAPGRTGRHLGVAFQIVDDVLGIWGDPLVTGKPVHGDLRERKKTFPVLAAPESPAHAAARPARLLESDGSLREMADLVEECGGRSAAPAEAHRPASAEPAHELRPLVDYLLRRDL